MKWLTKILLLLAVVFIVAGLSLPQSFHLSRTVTVQAHQARVIRQFNPERWEAWWPWNRCVACNRLTVHTNAAPAKVVISWQGRPAPGTLSITTNSIYCVSYDIQFDANKAKDKGEFRIRPTGGGTEVTWSVDCHYEIPVLGGYLAKIADAMHGGMLSWGLSNIKDLAESDKTEMFLIYQDEEGNDVEEKID